MVYKSCILLALVSFSLCTHGTDANTDTCRVAGLCGEGGSFKQITFNFTSVGGMPVVQGPPGNDGIDASVTQEMLDEIKDSVMTDMNYSLVNIADSIEALQTNMSRLEMMVLDSNNLGVSVVDGTTAAEILSQIRFVELALQLHARTVAALDQKVSNVEAVIDGQNRMLTKLNEDVRKLKYSSECSGISIAGTCYFVIHQKIDHPTAQAECAKNQATLASITSQELYDVLYNDYIIDEVIMADKSAVFLWLGSSLADETDDVLDGNGELIEFSHWLPGWPRDQNRFNQITWLVMRDPNMTYHGMLNSHPMTVSYPLCERTAPQQASGHCPVLLAPENGSIQFVGSSNHTAMNSVAVVVCDPDFVMAEDEAYVLICTESGHWSSSMPTCHHPPPDEGYSGEGENAE